MIEDTKGKIFCILSDIEKEKGFLIGLFNWENLKEDKTKEKTLIKKLDKIDRKLVIEFEELLEEIKAKYYEATNHITTLNFDAVEQNINIEFENC